MKNHLCQNANALPRCFPCALARPGPAVSHRALRFPVTIVQPRFFLRMFYHGAGAAQVPGAEASQEQGGGGGLGAQPGPEEGRSCYRPQEGAHCATAKAQEGPGGRDPEED